MPNWSYTEITVTGDKNKLENFQKKVKEWTSKEYMKSDFDLMWLGNIVGNSGLESRTENKDFDIACRGDLTQCEMYGDKLTICTRTAWRPMLKMWTELLKREVGDYELVFNSEDDCGNYFISSDPEIYGKYRFDIWENDLLDELELPDNDEWYISKERLVSLLQKLFNTVVSNVDELIEMFDNSDYADMASINVWEKADIETYLE